MPKSILLTFFIIICYLSSFAQKYGNEWIDYSLKYSKISITEEGLYKISYDDVIANDLQTGVLDPNKFQLFNKGIEVPMLITNSQTGIFKKGDDLFFYGNKNDASLDKVLYTNQADLPNDEVSLFTNENYYFLTYNPLKNGLRYQNQNLNSTGITSENFVIAKERLNFDSSYYPGEYILEAMSLSEYIEGEGYLGPTFFKGQSVGYQLNTSNFISSTYDSNLSFFVAGRSNASSTNNLGKNHHFRISNGSINLLDSLYRGYQTIRKTIPIKVNSSSTNISISSVDDLGAVTDFQALGYLEVNYSRNLDLNGLKNLSFKLDKVKPFALLSFSNIALTTPIILEKNGYNWFVSSGSNSFVLKDVTVGSSYFLTDQSLAKKAVLNNIVFKNINSNTSKNYLIISNSLLKDGAEVYQNYNQSIGMPTSLVYTDDLYNEFYYGFHHPLALRNYCSFMIDKGNIKPEYLLLLGKGFENSRADLIKDLVPTIGFPASDNMLTSGLNGSNLEPGLATGRIPARNNTDIFNYLEKLKVYNSLGNDLWRKKILHISGGKTISENQSFLNYQNLLFEKAKREFFGASNIIVKKNVANPTTDLLTDKIVTETQNGIGLISFLGHGSPNVTEILLGEPNKLLNGDKPSIYLINGCSTGSVFNTFPSLGEQFILQKNYGAVGWIGTTSEGVASYLNNASLNFYSNWFKKYYNNSISTGIQLGLKEYQNKADKLNLAHIRQYIFLGDPYLKFYSPSKPDYSVDNFSISILSDQKATSRFFNVKINFNNLGKSIDEKVSIKISRILPDNSQFVLPDTTLKIFNTDSLILSFDNSNLNIIGNNKIIVEINKNHIIDESNYSNNIVSKDYFIPGNSIQTITPINKSIVQNDLLLTVQSENIFTKSAEYLFELDTTPRFDSNLLAKSGIIKTGILASWRPTGSFRNNTVYYWRARLNLPITDGGAWVSSSFTFIKDFPSSGYNIAHNGQIEDLKRENLTIKNPFGFNFKTYNMLTVINTKGDEGPYNIEKRLRVDGFLISYAPLDFDGVSIATFNPKNYTERFQYPSPYNYINPPASGPYEGPSGQYVWDISNATAVDSLLSYLKQIPKGYHIIGYNGHNAAFDKLPNEVKDEFRKLGLTKLEIVKKGEPYCFWITKGDLTSVKEVTADYNSTIPPVLQSLSESKSIVYAEKSGNFVTGNIGPASSWSTLDFDINNTINDNFIGNIIGIDSLGNEKQISTFSNLKQIDISKISVKTYPYLKLKYFFNNTLDAIMPSIQYLRVLFKSTADISWDTELIGDYLQNNSFEEGDSIKWNLGVKNIGLESSDSLTIKYVLSSEKKEISNQIRLPFILKSNESKPFIVSIPTIGFNGKSILSLSVNQNNFKEQNLNNNTISKSIIINKDIKPPLLNVSFDGRQIINGEIISPTPIIRIVSNDENKFILMNDTSLVDIFIKRVDELNYKRISYSSPNLIFSPATSLSNNQVSVNYKPERLKDGTYSLKIKSTDKNGNQNISNDYLVEFEVINTPSITNFYPYPNPATDKMKFVFTLTGQKIPDDIKIQILTSTGKIVKEISKLELGNLKIGTNLTDFTWDCRDQFGDRLANGVYFYKLIVKDSEKIDHRNTAGDKYFKNQIGKIYLLN